ncbi:MAG: sigma-54 dependent transcriptional regulator [Myxococcota bacterium]
MATILIADDEANLRKVLGALLEQDGHQTTAVSDGQAALDFLRHQSVDLLITDLKMPGMDGLALLDAIQRSPSGPPVIVITAHGTVDTAVSALKKGAIDYITKPFDKDELKLAVRKGLSLRRQDHGYTGNADISQRYRIIGKSRAMQVVFNIIDKVANTPSTVLISGESGTGKELVATALHENSVRKDKPYIRVNCAAIPKDLIESEFFGYEKGAFTGAVGSKPGRFELADGGTLFLDEIGEIPIEMQVKLLRALQEGEFERVGGVRTERVDVRLIAATNRDLAAQVEAGYFRDDLYYRLNVVPIALPALRDRTDDIPLLAEAFVSRYNERLGKEVREISPEALRVLQGYRWPGNIRELENVIERTLLFCEGTRIEREDLPTEFHSIAVTPTESSPSAQGTLPALDQGSSMKDIVRQATAGLERDLILKALDETHGNVTRAANLLRISRKGLQNKMKEFGLREEK